MKWLRLLTILVLPLTASAVPHNYYASSLRRSDALAWLGNELLTAEYFIKRPTSPDSVFQASVRNAAGFSRLTNGQLLALVFNHMVAGFIVSLLLERGPFTVVFTIITIVVDPFNRMTRGWPLAHIGVKTLKRFPLDYNPATAVSIKPVFVRVFTPVLHARVNIVLRDRSHPVFSYNSMKYFPMKTPATLGASASQTLGDDNCFFAAITPTKPARPPAPVFFGRKELQSE